MPRSSPMPQQLHLDGLPPIHPNAAGIDIGADELVVAVPSDRDLPSVRAFPTFTHDLQVLVDWLVACQIDTVALESTGMYWIPIYNDISGGKVLRSRTQKVVNRASQAFRQAAQAVARSASAISSFYRSMRARKGPQQAIVATAHKIARTVYHLLKYGEAYEVERTEDYERKRQERELRALTRRANKLGYTLAQASESTPASPI